MPKKDVTAKSGKSPPPKKKQSAVVTKDGIPQNTPMPPHSSRTGGARIYEAKIHDKSIYDILAAGGFYAHFCREHNLTRETIHAWKKNHPSFNDALQRGKMAGLAFWLDLPRENSRMDSQYWTLIMRNMYKIQNPVLPDLTESLTAAEIVKVATRYYARGKIACATFDRLINLALAKVKIDESTKMQDDIKLIADKIGLKIAP